jgi:TolB-like protein
MKFLYLISLIAVFLITTSIDAQTIKMQIAVVDLQAAGISLVEAQTFTERLRSELVKSGQFTILERAEMEEILNEQGFQLTGCTSAECAVEVGKLLNVRQICAGSVGKIGGVYSISARLIDVESGKIIRSVTEDCQCPIERVLTVSVRNIVLKIIGNYRSITVQSDPSDATVFLDGVEQGKTPVLIGLEQDRVYQLKISKLDHEDWTRTLDLKKEDITTVSAELEKHKGKLRFSGNYNQAKLSLGKNTITISKAEYELPVGIYTFTISRYGFYSEDFSVNIAKNKTSTYNVSLKPKTKGSAFLRSAVLPGWGQSYQDKKISPWIYSVLFIGSGAGAIAYTLKYNDAVSEYNNVHDSYLAAVEEAEISSLRKTMQENFDTVESSENLRNIFYAATAIIWVWNVIDVFILPAAWENSMQISSTGIKNTYALTVSVSF